MEIEETRIDDPKKSEEFHNLLSSDKGNVGGNLTKYEQNSFLNEIHLNHKDRFQRIQKQSEVFRPIIFYI